MKKVSSKMIKQLKGLSMEKRTYNGDRAYRTTGNNLIDVLFMAEYFSFNLDALQGMLGTSPKEQAFAMMMRDPRNGLGYKDLGRTLMALTEVEPEDIVKAGRFDDLYLMFTIPAVLSNEKALELMDKNFNFFVEEMLKENHYALKWAPRLTSRHKEIGHELRVMAGLSPKEYRKLIKKANTVEQKITEKDYDAIEYEKVPSLAMMKYFQAFDTNDNASFEQFMLDVNSGKQKLKTSVVTPYDLYKARNRVPADEYFNSLEPVELSILPVVDVSGSMMFQDALGKALSIGHFLGTHSTSFPKQMLTFSKEPEFVSLDGKYNEVMKRMESSNWGLNTDLAAAFDLIIESQMDLPKYLIVLSDMEFDMGSSVSIEALSKMLDEENIPTKIVWWNFNAHSKTAPRLADEEGRFIFLSGYNASLLKLLELDFNMEEYLDALIADYAKKVGKEV